MSENSVMEIMYVLLLMYCSVHSVSLLTLQANRIKVWSGGTMFIAGKSVQ